MQIFNSMVNKSNLNSLSWGERASASLSESEYSRFQSHESTQTRFRSQPRYKAYGDFRVKLERAQ